MENKSQKGLWAVIGILVLVVFVLVYFLFISKANTMPERNLLSATVNSTASVEVGNAIPAASNTVLNGGGSITLIPSPSTTSVVVTGTLTDANGCNDLSSVNVAVYKNGTTCTSSGNANDDNCYFINIASSSFSGCTGGSDTIASVSNTFDFKYFADPGTWSATITPSDIIEVGTANTSSVAVNETIAINVPGTLSYGAVAGGAASTGDHTTTVTNLGNVAIDYNLKGADLVCTGTNSQGLIPVGNLEYALASFLYGAGTDLTASDVAVNADLATTSSSVISDDAYWQVSVPSGVRGICSGAITFTAIPAI